MRAVFKIRDGVSVGVFLVPFEGKNRLPSGLLNLGHDALNRSGSIDGGGASAKVQHLQKFGDGSFFVCFFTLAKCVENLFKALCYLSGENFFLKIAFLLRVNLI